MIFILASMCTTKSFGNKTAQEMKSSNPPIKKNKRMFLQDFFFLNFWLYSMKFFLYLWSYENEERRGFWLNEIEMQLLVAFQG